MNVYLGGSALLFQLPLLIWFIDKINPRGPKPFIKFERYVIAGSFIIAGLMAPVPNIIYQAMIAVPIILMYQFAVILVWLKHRTRKSNSYNYKPETASLVSETTERAKPEMIPDFTATIAEEKQPILPVLKRGIYIDGILPKNPSNMQSASNLISNTAPKTTSVNYHTSKVRATKLIQEIFTPDSSQRYFV